MNVYVETNFVLELVFQQEQSQSCENILDLCKSQDVNLFIPAYCLAEPHEKLRRQHNHRQELQRVLNLELKQLIRTAPYTTRVAQIEDVSDLLIQSSLDERLRFTQVRQQILQLGTVLSLTSDNLIEAAAVETDYNLSAQDAIVFASVIAHLQTSRGTTSCFLNRNSRDFDNFAIANALEGFSCKMIPRFEDGYNYIQSRI